MSAETSAPRCDLKVASTSDATSPRKLVAGFLSSYLTAVLSLHDAEEIWFSAKTASTDAPTAAAELEALAKECSELAAIVEKRSKHVRQSVLSAIASIIGSAKTVDEASLLAQYHATLLTEWLKYLPVRLAKHHNRWSVLMYDREHRPVVLSIGIHPLSFDSPAATNSEDLIRDVFSRLNGAFGPSYTARQLPLPSPFHGNAPTPSRQLSLSSSRLPSSSLAHGDLSPANIFLDRSVQSQSVLHLRYLAFLDGRKRMVHLQQVKQPPDPAPLRLPTIPGSGILSIPEEQRTFLGLISRQEGSTVYAARLQQLPPEELADLKATELGYNRTQMYRQALEMFNFDFEYRCCALADAITRGTPNAPYKTIGEERVALRISDAEFVVAPWMCVVASPFYRHLEYLSTKELGALGLPPIKDRHQVQSVRRAAKACGISFTEWVVTEATDSPALAQSSAPNDPTTARH